MGLLDEDKEELKQTLVGSNPSGTGRKVNKSGLGAFKSLNKYSSLTDKYRNKQSAPKTEMSTDEATKINPPSVEQSRGTIRTQSERNSDASPNSTAINSNPSSELHSNDIRMHFGLKSDAIKNKDLQFEQPASELHPNKTEQENQNNNSDAIRMQNDNYEENSTTYDISSESKGQISSDETPKENLINNSKNKPDFIRTASQLHSNSIGMQLGLNSDEKRINPTPNQDLASEYHPDAVRMHESELRKTIPLNVEIQSPIKETSETVLDLEVKLKEFESSLNPSTEIIQSSTISKISLNSYSHEARPLLNNSEDKEVTSKQNPKALENSFIIKKSEKMNSDANRMQLGLHSDAIRTKSELNSGAIRMQKALHSNASSDANSNDIRMQNNMENDISIKLFSMSKTEKKILSFIHRKCSSNLSLETTPIFRDEILKEVGSPLATIKSCIQRLVKDNLLQIIRFKSGAGGWTIYALPEVVFDNYSDANSDADSDEKRSSKLVRNLNNTNLTQETPKNLDSELYSANFSSLEEFKISRSIINDILKNKWNITLNQLEDHIERFSEWAGDRGNIRQIRNPRAFFCNNIKTISETGVDPLDFIKTSQEKALDDLLIKRKKVLEEKKRREEELLEVEFELWKDSKTQEELSEIIPPSQIIPVNSEIYKKQVYAYFSENIWPKIKNEFKF